MRDFQFYFDGKVNIDGSVNAGIKLMSGDPIDIANTLGTYATLSLKLKNEPAAAIIVINAFKKFMELNPEMTEQMVRTLTMDATDSKGFYKKIDPGIIKKLN
jgi:hypothetical protein